MLRNRSTPSQMLPLSPKYPEDAAERGKRMSRRQSTIVLVLLVSLLLLVKIFYFVEAPPSPAPPIEEAPPPKKRAGPVIKVNKRAQPRSRADVSRRSTSDSGPEALAALSDDRDDVAAAEQRADDAPRGPVTPPRRYAGKKRRARVMPRRS